MRVQAVRSQLSCMCHPPEADGARRTSVHRRRRKPIMRLDANERMFEMPARDVRDLLRSMLVAPLTANDVRKRFKLSRSGAAELLARLQKAGCIQPALYGTNAYDISQDGVRLANASMMKP